MPTLTKGSFSLNSGIVKLGGDLSDDDRQCAWELYTELSTRAAVIGMVEEHTAEGMWKRPGSCTFYACIPSCSATSRTAVTGGSSDTADVV